MSNALLNAAEQGDLKKVQELISKGANPAFVHKGTGRNFVMEAAIMGYLNVVQYGIECCSGIDINQTDTAMGFTALGWALEEKKPIIFEYLINKGADVNLSRDKYNRTPLIWALRGKYVKGAKTLLSHKADIHHIGKDKKNALLWAEENGMEDLVKTIKNLGSICPPKIEEEYLDWPKIEGHEVDYSDPLKVLSCFMCDMKLWEDESRRKSENVQLNWELEILRPHDHLVQKYCTNKKRVYSGGRGVGHNYNQGEKVVSVNVVNKSRVEIMTRETVEKFTRFEKLYILLHKNHEWRIDSKKTRPMFIDKWDNDIL